MLSALFRDIVPDALQLVRKKLHETVPTTNHSLVMSCFNVMDAMLKPYAGQEGTACCKCDDYCRKRPCWCRVVLPIELAGAVVTA